MMVIVIGFCCHLSLYVWRTGGGMDWGGFGGNRNGAGGGTADVADGRNVYLASISSFKAFNLPFSVVGRALEPKGGPLSYD